MKKVDYKFLFALLFILFLLKYFFELGEAYGRTL
jgi:hypothetical protein